MNKLKVGERVTVNRKGVKDCGTVRFIGATHFGDGNDEWIGVELDQLDRGNNNGSKDGITYFTCAQKAGVFVRAKAVTRESQRPLLASAATSRISQIRRKHTATDVTSTSSQSLQAHATRSAVKAVKPDHLKPISPPITRTETPAPSSEKLNNGNVEPLKGQQVSNLSENNDIILRILSREIGKEDYFFKVKVSRNCSLETFKIAVHKKAGNPFLEIKHMTYNEDGITFHILDDEDILDAFKATYVVVHWQFTVNIAQKVATSNTSDAPLVEFSKQSNAFMQFQASPRDNSSKSAFDLQKPWYLMLLNDWVCHANSVIHDWFVSYRVAADSDTAKIFVLLLSHKRLDVHPFLDVFCLNFAEPWEQGFLTCLSNSKIFVPILSNQGMESMKNAHKYPDNLLLEWEISLELQELKLYPIQPIFLGEQKLLNDGYDHTIEVLVPYKFSVHDLPDEFHCHGLSPRKRTIRETVKAIMKIQAIKVDNPRELDRAVTECHNLLAKYSALPSTSSIQLDSNTVKTLTNWLNPLTEDMRHETSRLLNSHVSGTRSWLLESVLDFLDPTTAASENRVLWLQGGPGVGKSVMSALTADKLRQRNLLGAVLYAKHDNEARNNPQQLINTMVFGLCEWSNEFSQLVLVIYQNNPKILQEPVSDIFKELISNPLKKLFAKNPTYSPVVIIADALDECGKIGERREILEIFSVHCKDLPPKIKLFITSRLEPDIVQAFSSLPTIALEPSNDQNKEDALIFSKHFLQTHSAEDVAIEQGPAILVENSAGVFVWLVVACKILELAATDCITLEEIKSTTLSTGAGNSGLDHLFSSMLNRIFSEAESSSLLHVLATIVCVFEPLTTQAIADLISLDLVVVTASVQKLDALLLFDTDTKTVRVFHKSIADYLTDSTRCLDTNFGVHLPTWHTCLALGTISYLNQFLHFNMCNLPINKLHKEVEDFAHEVSSHISSTAVYASAYFHKHIQEAHLKVLPEDLLDFLFFHNAHHWIELMSLLGKTGQIVHSVVSLQKSLSGISVSSLFQHMLQDVKRVLQQWFIPIEASALQVYCTAILMAPTESLFYKTYFPLLPPQIPVPAITPQAAQWPICINTLESHKDRVFAVAVSTDGQFVVSGSWDKTVKIWDVHTGAVQKTLLGHSDEVYAIAISADSQFIASGSSDRTVKLWDVQTGAVQKTLKGHSKAVRAVAISPGGQFIVSGSADTTVRIWDAQTGVVQKTLTGHTDYVRSVAISANEWFVVSGSSDKTVKIWNVESGEVLKTLEGHSTFVCSVAISVNEQFIVSGSDDTTVKIWDVETGTVQNTLVGHSNTVSTVAISADGCFVVSGSWDKTVKIWDVLTGAVQMTLEANYSIVYSVAVSRDGQFVVSGSDDMTVKIWDTQNAALQNSLDGHNDVVSVVAISTNEQLVVSGSKDNTLKIWNVQAGTVEKTLEGHSNAVYCIAISTDNQFIVSGSWDHSVIIWDVPMGKLLKKLIGHRHAVDSVTISADGHFVVSGSWDTTVIIWDVQSGKLYKRLEGHSGPVSALAISFDGQFVVSGSWDKRVKIWNMQTGIVQMTLEGHSGYITAVTISRDMQFVASGSWDESIKIWDRATRIVQNLENLTNYVYAVTVNASNNLISGSWDNTAKIWNAHTGALLKNSSAEKSFPPQESEYKFYAKTTADTHCLAIKDMWLCGINCNCFTWIAPEWRSEISVQGSLFACVNEKGALFCKIE